MSEEATRTRKPRQTSVVVEDMDAMMGRKATPSADASAGGESLPDAGNVTGLAAALGREIYTWTSPFTAAGVAPVEVRFRRAPGGTREMVARVLGPEQSQNQTILREYLALASIVEMNHQSVQQPRTLLTFQALKKRVGFVGPKDEDWMDEPIVMFVFAYEAAMYPEQLQIAADLSGAGLSPDDERRILKNAGLDRPKR